MRGHDSLMRNHALGLREGKKAKGVLYTGLSANANNSVATAVAKNSSLLAKYRDSTH